MRSHLLALLLASAALVPVAHADTYQFTFNGVFEPNMYVGPRPATLSFSWQISGLPTSVLMYPYYYLEYTDVTFSPNPFIDHANLSLYSYASMGSTEEAAQFYNGDGTSYSPLNITTPKSFYTGDESNPQFLPGTYQAESEFHDRTIYDGTLAVSDVSTVTPEPSTLALLGTGLLGAGALRRWLVHA